VTARARAVTVVRTSTANLASVLTGFERLGCRVRAIDAAGDVAAAERLVLPGVGAFAAAQRAIASHGLEDALRERIERGRPTLGICLGMQLMATGSEEAPGVCGLGVFDGVVGGYESGDEGWRVPQMGWNLVTPDARCEIVPRGYAYFANSYRLAAAPDGWLPSVRYLVEELGVDINARDHNGYNALHHAASRGDVEMIRYLAERGTDVLAVSRRGQTTADMANGPYQRTQPFPDALELLESLGAHNNDNCVSC